jgi:hypothetical protein
MLAERQILHCKYRFLWAGLTLVKYCVVCVNMSRLLPAPVFARVHA